MDIWHPELSDKEVKFFKMIQQARLKNGKKYLEQLEKYLREINDTEKENEIKNNNFFKLIEESKSLLKNDDWWVG